MNTRITEVSTKIKARFPSAMYTIPCATKVSEVNRSVGMEWMVCEVRGERKGGYVGEHVKVCVGSKMLPLYCGLVLDNPK